MVKGRYSNIWPNQTIVSDQSELTILLCQPMNSLLLMKTTLPWYSGLQLLPSYIYDPWLIGFLSMKVAQEYLQHLPILMDHQTLAVEHHSLKHATKDQCTLSLTRTFPWKKKVFSFYSFVVQNNAEMFHGYFWNRKIIFTLHSEHCSHSAAWFIPHCVDTELWTFIE